MNERAAFRHVESLIRGLGVYCDSVLFERDAVRLEDLDEVKIHRGKTLEDALLNVMMFVDTLPRVKRPKRWRFRHPNKEACALVERRCREVGGGRWRRSRGAWT